MTAAEVLAVLSRRPRWQMICMSLAMVSVLGLVDYLTGDFSLTMFYLMPVFVTTWFVGRWSGFAISMLSGFAIIAAHQIVPAPRFNPTMLVIWNSGMDICFLVIMNFMFSMLKHELDVERSLARTDPLTGALNRRSFLELLEYELNRSRRYRRELTVAYIDLDNFKYVNDRLGHHTGDLLLCTVARTLRENCRITDLQARLGGDEFCLLYPETPAAEVSELLENLRDRLLHAMRESEWPVTFSIGAVTYLTPPASAETMLREADARMYEVKRSGKNLVSHATIGFDMPVGHVRERR